MYGIYDLGIVCKRWYISLFGHPDLKHYTMNEVSSVGCNYIGRLQNDPTSSLAVTGCLNKPGDKMEVTLISKNNKNIMFSVDFEGNVETLKIPYEEGGI